MFAWYACGFHLIKGRWLYYFLSKTAGTVPYSTCKECLGLGQFWEETSAWGPQLVWGKKYFLREKWKKNFI